jgi:hypothetical protein
MQLDMQPACIVGFVSIPPPDKVRDGTDMVYRLEPP